MKMGKHLKKIFILTAIIAVFGLVTSCGDDDDDSAAGGTYIKLTGGADSTNSTTVAGDDYEGTATAATSGVEVDKLPQASQSVKLCGVRLEFGSTPVYVSWFDGVKDITAGANETATVSAIITALGKDNIFDYQGYKFTLKPLADVTGADGRLVVNVKPKPSEDFKVGLGWHASDCPDNTPFAILDDTIVGTAAVGGKAASGVLPLTGKKAKKEGGETETFTIDEVSLNLNAAAQTGAELVADLVTKINGSGIAGNTAAGKAPKFRLGYYVASAGAGKGTGATHCGNTDEIKAATQCLILTRGLVGKAGNTDIPYNYDYEPADPPAAE